jgi:hypothetical protein
MFLPVSETATDLSRRANMMSVVRTSPLGRKHPLRTCTYYIFRPKGPFHLVARRSSLTDSTVKKDRAMSSHVVSTLVSTYVLFPDTQRTSLPCRRIPMPLLDC